MLTFQDCLGIATDVHKQKGAEYHTLYIVRGPWGFSVSNRSFGVPMDRAFIEEGKVTINKGICRSCGNYYDDDPRDSFVCERCLLFFRELENEMAIQSNGDGS